MASSDISRVREKVRQRLGHDGGIGYREPTGGRVKSADDLRTDSLRGKAMREGTKGSWNRVEDMEEYRRRMDLLNFPCPKCGKNVMRRKEGPAECVHCGTLIKNGGR